MVLGVALVASAVWTRLWIADAHRFDWTGERATAENRKELWNAWLTAQQTRGDFDREKREKQAEIDHWWQELQNQKDEAEKDKIVALTMKLMERKTDSEEWEDSMLSLSSDAKIATWRASLPRVHAATGAAAVLGLALAASGLVCLLRLRTTPHVDVQCTR